MSFAPSFLEQRARAGHDLRLGLPIVLTGETPALILAAETLTPERFSAALALGETTLALTDWRAQTLKARAYDGDLARVNLPADVTTGWIRALADPSGDLAHPMKGPLHTARDGDAQPHRAAIALTKAARLLPAALVTPLTEIPDGILTLPTDAALDLAAPRVTKIASARIPLSVHPDGRLHVFRDPSGEEHYAIEIGTPSRDDAILTRLHSACFTGDLLGSLKCDCGPQLRAALAAMAGEGAGILLYLNQEGRGIGLANKMRAYSLQDEGFDTVEANHRLGFEDDERDFRLGAALLRQLGVSRIRLMTNNPAKIARMESCDITVTDRVPVRVGETPENTAYLATKAAKSGHLL